MDLLHVSSASCASGEDQTVGRGWGILQYAAHFRGFLWFCCATEVVEDMGTEPQLRSDDNTGVE